MNASNTTDITAASFFTRANHEIRNMMTLIRGSLQLIETKHPHVRAFEHWMQTMDNIRNLNELLTDLSDYIHSVYPCEMLPDEDPMHLSIPMSADADDAQSEDSPSRVPNTLAETPLHMFLRKEYCDLYRLARSVCSEFQEDAFSKGISISLNSQPDALNSLQSFYCSPPKMQRILVNLIKNALEAATSGSTVEVLFSLTPGEDRFDTPNLVLEVRNTGSLIPYDVLNQIFCAFYTTKATGTGLGLPIVKQLVELHGGTITVSSEDNSVTFRMTLPFD